jgi:hypothetical protein
MRGSEECTGIDGGIDAHHLALVDVDAKRATQQDFVPALEAGIAPCETEVRAEPAPRGAAQVLGIETAAHRGRECVHTAVAVVEPEDAKDWTLLESDILQYGPAAFGAGRYVLVRVVPLPPACVFHTTP